MALKSDLKPRVKSKISNNLSIVKKLLGVFIIDTEGIIQYCNFNNLLCGRSINELIRILKSIQYIKENPGQACPVDWKYGDQILYSHPLKSKVYFKTLYSNK